MTGPEHYRAAEQCVRAAKELGDPGPDYRPGGRRQQLTVDEELRLLTLVGTGQIHAALAQAAATVSAAGGRGDWGDAA